MDVPKGSFTVRLDYYFALFELSLLSPLTTIIADFIACVLRLLFLIFKMIPIDIPFFIFFIFCTRGFCSEAQDRLIKELFLSRDYDRMSRPIDDPKENVTVNFGLTLNILVFVSDMDQVMKTNGYLELDWKDNRLTWKPEDYGGIGVLRLPVDKIWQPDIALTNTVDGQFWPNFKSNALIYSDGSIYWVPPFIFKAGCDTNPYYFPFDEQLCNMVFRSVTYHAREVDVVLKRPKMELKDYVEQPSGTWDITKVPLAKLYRNETRKHGVVQVVSVQLDLTVRRKSQFYVITFLLPCVCIAFLTVFVFYLPTASGEKLCLAISILFSIVIFLLILIDILPPSDSLPLMTKFLVFTFVCNLTSTILTTIIVNWNYRTIKTYRMASWIRHVFLEFLPKVLHVRKPEKPEKKKLFTSDGYNPPVASQRSAMRKKESDGSRQNSVRFAKDPSNDQYKNSQTESPKVLSKNPMYGAIGGGKSAFSSSKDSAQSAVLRELHQLGEYLERFPGYDDALNNIAFIAKDMEQQDEESEIADEWKFVAVVADRLMLWIFFMGNAIGSFSILLNSPHLFTEREKP